MALATAALAGCGFEPMYAPRSSPGPVGELAAIGVEQIPDRIGQQMRNDLIELLTPMGQPAYPRYRLRVTIRQSSEPLAIQLDDTITRFNLRLDVAFTLIDEATGQALYRDRTRAVGSYDAVQSDFATLTAQQDSTRRAVREASEDIQTLLAVYFGRQRDAAG